MLRVKREAAVIIFKSLVTTQLSSNSGNRIRKQMLILTINHEAGEYLVD